jgi:hypothetical protein
MMRKLLMVAAAIAMPLGTVAVASVSSSVASSGVAGATVLSLSCKLPASTVTFQAPNGISDNGATTTSAKSKTKTAAGALNCGGSGTGAIPAQTIKSKNTLCVGTNNPIPGCTPTLYTYGSGGGFSGSATTIWQSLPTITFTVTTHSYTITNTSSNSIAPISGGKCGASESGFKIVGHISAPATYAGNATQLIACLTTDTGPNTTGNFTTDIANVIGGTDSPAMNIDTSALDPVLSKIKVT